MDFSSSLLHPLVPDCTFMCTRYFFFLLNYFPAYFLIRCSIWLVTKKENNACHMQQPFVYCLDKSNTSAIRDFAQILLWKDFAFLSVVDNKSRGRGQNFWLATWSRADYRISVVLEEGGGALQEGRRLPQLKHAQWVGRIVRILLRTKV